MRSLLEVGMKKRRRTISLQRSKTQARARCVSNLIRVVNLNFKSLPNPFKLHIPNSIEHVGLTTDREISADVLLLLSMILYNT